VKQTGEWCLLVTRLKQRVLIGSGVCRRSEEVADVPELKVAYEMPLL
jgi:hypothetical protein